MHSNNEVGVIQPIPEIAALCRRADIPPRQRVAVHTDGAQSTGKVSLRVDDLGVDFLTVVGHKFGAPKGVAALYCREGHPALPPFLRGGGQEGGRRAGTENVLLCVGLGRAAKIVTDELELTRAHMARTRLALCERLCAGLDAQGAAWRINGPPCGFRGSAVDPRRLPNTLSLAIEGVNAGRVLARLTETVAASAAAACHTSEPGADAPVSAVIKALKVPAAFACGTLRLSTGRHTTLSEVEAATAHILEAVAAERKLPKL